MPNPYHNHLGEFCAKEDMQASIKMLTETGQIDKALQLTTELKTIEDAASKKAFLKSPAANNVVVQENVERLVKSSLYLRGEATDTVFHCGKILENIEDKDLPTVVSILEAEKEVWAETTLNPAIEAESDRSAAFREITGYADYFALNSARKSATIQAESASHQIFNQIKEEAIANGIPENYARYFVASSKTRLGYADDYVLSSGGKVSRPEDITPLDFKSFPTNIRNKEFKEKYIQALEKVTENPENKAIMETINQNAQTVNSINEAARKAPTVEGSLERSRKIANVRNQVENYNKLITGVKGLTTWRKTLRSAGIKTNKITPVNVSTLNGSNIARDKNGTVKNMWAVNKNGDSSSVDRIVGVTSNEHYTGMSYLLVGESGQKYNDFTHYHSRRADRQTAQIIVDDSVKVTNPLTDDVRFSASIDSGD